MSQPGRFTAWWARTRTGCAAAAREPRTYAALAAAAVVLFGVLRLLEPMGARWDTYGFHDWDVATAYRYITTVSLLQYGEPPWWHPWLCGGFPGFGYIEGATNFLSPYLPFYLLLDVRQAIRVEVLGATLTGAVGAFLLAGRFTESAALRAFVAALFVLNGRWSLQLATGHTWHLQFAFLPWALYFFERAQDEDRLHEAIYAGVAVACMGLFGGIYPLPYTALTLSAYALCLGAFRVSWRPLVAAVVCGVTGFGLAAPKLLAVVEGMTRAPRLIASTEVIGVAELLVMLTDTTQRYGTFPVRVPAYNWHEWGIYIGSLPLFCLAVGVLFARGPREHSLKLVGLLMLFLGLGAFHRYAPWTLLHELPVFSSLHVPSRFHFVMVLLLALVFVAWAAPHVDGWVRRAPWVDFVLLVPVLALVVDLTTIARRPVAQAFVMEAPEHVAAAPTFEHATRPVVEYRVRDWAPPVLLPMMANTGLIKCYGVPESFPVGALARDDPRYRGMAYIADGPGAAVLEQWTPNQALVRVRGAAPGALLVYNMNYDGAWRASGRPALEYENKVAVRLEPGQDVVRFTYRPRSLGLGALVFAVTLAACGAVLWRRRRRATARGGFTGGPAEPGSAAAAESPGP